MLLLEGLLPLVCLSWTYAGGPHDYLSYFLNYDCPCKQNSIAITPPFVGTDYYCESGIEICCPSIGSLSNDPLWDGQQCGGGEAPVDVFISDNVTCTAIVDNPGKYLEWYWKLPLFIVYCTGKTIIGVLLFEFVIAQSPDKMKGFVFGITITTRGLVFFIFFKFIYNQLTLCCLLFVSLGLVVLFVVFLILSKCYTLRERNREINLQAIVEEHYERYMDQEEEYNRENPQSYYDSDGDCDIDVSNTQ